MARSKTSTPTKTTGTKREREEEDVKHSNGDQAEDQRPAPKQAKNENTKNAESPRSSRSKSKKQSVDKAKLNSIMDAYGVLPLQDTELGGPTEATPETILALVYLAMLTSARINHELAYKSLQCLIESGYHDLETLKKSTWDERTKVLTKGGYTRYREKTATALGELAKLVEKKYDGDLNNLLKQADSSPKKVRSLIQEIKGIGKVGSDIFFDAAQGVWPALAPFVDPRSRATAQTCGLGSESGALWEAVGKNPVEMCKLSSALTMIRLDKQEMEFQ